LFLSPIIPPTKVKILAALGNPSFVAQRPSKAIVGERNIAITPAQIIANIGNSHFKKNCSELNITKQGKRVNNTG